MEIRDDVGGLSSPLMNKFSQEAQLQVEKVKSTENAERIAKNKALIAEANKRFGQLGEYNILGEATVYFANGSTTVEPQYKQELQKLAQQAKGITAYILLVQGYASKVGSAALNQRLSSERAENVTVYLEQDCQIPLTNMLAPGAMGTSQQVASDNTAEGQAENRRVVVKILQTKVLPGREGSSSNIGSCTGSFFRLLRTQKTTPCYWLSLSYRLRRNPRCFGRLLAYAKINQRVGGSGPPTSDLTPN